jgi:signal transduction histidine kinase/CheY-like chemotaxis protein
MPSLTREDRLLLGILVPVFLVCFALHVAEVRRSGLAQLPVWALADAAGGPPTVGGYRVETDSAGTALRPGDRLLRVGETDLRGAGYVEFDALALEAVGAGGEAPLVFERDGVRHETRIRARPRPYAWSRPLVIGIGGLLVVFIVLRAPGRPDAQRFAVALLAYAILMSQFYGGPAWKSRTSLWLWNLGGPIVGLLLLRWARLFPAEVPAAARAWWGWPWLGALGMLVVRTSYWWGAPISPRHLAVASQALHGGFMLGTLALLARNYAYAEPIGRRRLKWVLYGAAISAFPLAAAQLALLAWPDWEHFEVAFALGTVVAGSWAVFLLVAIVRAGAFDIDRLLSATASAVLLGVAFVGTLALAVPELASRVAAVVPIGEGAARLLVAVGLVLSFAPAYRRLRPWLDRGLFPARRLQEQGVEQLLRDLSQCASPQQVLDLVADRLDGIVRPESCDVYVAERGRFAIRGGRPGPWLPAAGPLARALERHPAPRRVAENELAHAVPELTAEEATALVASGTRVLLPLRCGKDLAAIVALGPRRSGDVYTDSDLTLLGAVAEKASAELLHQRDAETIRAERVRAEELAVLKSAADEVLRRRSRFLAAASHDLRQPLHALSMYTSLLRERIGNDDAKALIDQIERSTASLSEMFSSLLDLSRLDAGAVEPRVGPVALAPLLAELCAEASPSAEAKGLKLLYTPVDLAVRSDPVLLGRIVRNLLVNAVRYTERGEIRVEVRAAGARVVVEIADTGPGIPLDRQQMVFHEFVRLAPEGASRGLGLGLAIVDRLARTLGHALDLDSEPGGGSVFRLSLERAEPPMATAGAPKSTALHGRIVVLVDDDLAVLGATREVLESWGCRVVAATSANEACEAITLRALQPDAILADYRLGALDNGLDAIVAIRAACGREVPAAVLTGETSDGVGASVLSQKSAVGFSRPFAWLGVHRDRVSGPLARRATEAEPSLRRGSATRRAARRRDRMQADF